MAKGKWAVLYNDEQLIDSNYCETKEEAVKDWENLTGEKLEDNTDSHSVHFFTDEEIEEIEAYSEANPQ